MRPRTVKESLARLEAESWELYLAELRRLDVVVEEIAAPDWDTPLGQFLRSDAGTPLGHGYLSGTPIYGGEHARAHIDRWMGLLRSDPCSYCGQRGAGTVDHIRPRVYPDRETHTWLNMAGSCSGCNAAKGSGSLLEFLRLRALSAARCRRTADRRALPAAA